MLGAGSKAGAAVVRPSGRRVCPRAEASTQAGCAQPVTRARCRRRGRGGPAGAGGGLGCWCPGRVSWAPGWGVQWARGSRGPQAAVVAWGPSANWWRRGFIPGARWDSGGVRAPYGLVRPLPCPRGPTASGGGGRAAASWPGGHAALAPAEEVLESYENPPPIVLPSEGFQVDLEADCLDDSLHQHLLYIRHFLWSLRSKPSPGGRPARPECLQVPGWMQERGAPEAAEAWGAPLSSQHIGLPGAEFFPPSPRARNTPTPRATLRTRAAPWLPGTPAGEPVRPAWSALLLPRGTPRHRALWEGRQAA